MDRDSEFGEFVDARALVMRRTAYLLCGDWHRAEDIVQTALIKLYVAWSRVRKDSVDAYARKVLVRAAIDDGRRGFFRRERSVDAVPERPVADHAADLDLRMALDALPPGQRAVVVLRYWEDLSITETARILGRTEGTVKSQAAKGLAALRELLENEPVSAIHTADVIRAGRTRLARRRTAIASALALVLVLPLGSVVYLSRTMTTKDQGTAVSSADHNAELTALLRAANIIPLGVTAQKAAERNPLEFYTYDQARYAVARLVDAQGASGLTIGLFRTNEPGYDSCPDRHKDRECRIDVVNGIKVMTYRERDDTNGGVIWSAEAARPDGTLVQITSDNYGSFPASPPFHPDIGVSAARPEPVLGRDALIKIATLPGLTF
ncbi:SigE family RNA polymerase sigma factor [Lentzea sp. NPDC051213]|uniref:SigE family RNA polymerase sigma factor n=1 Tax=Lentzea sp. NPDC051213 TaxID=3364126 RepID=UPI0037AE55A8